MISTSKGIFVLALFSIVLTAAYIKPNNIHETDLKVAKILSILGHEMEAPIPDTNSYQISAAKGESIIKSGIATKPGGGKTKKQSKHFLCTSCHNLEKEDPDLSIIDPQARLEYTNSKGLPFLQGTTLYGAINRESYYNDDYYKKYGDLVLPARNDIKEAIQLCAVECAQGRELKDWEIESIVAFLWTIDLKLSDLNMNQDELDRVYAAIDGDGNKKAAVELIRSKYTKTSPATFGTAHESLIMKGEYTGDADNGKLIYDNSCLHCHQNRKYSFFQLDDSRLTFKHLSKKANGYGRHSLYQVTRYGVYSRSGKQSYMPQYPKEKMSEQQLADLRAYIDQQAE